MEETAHTCAKKLQSLPPSAYLSPIHAPALPEKEKSLCTHSAFLPPSLHTTPACLLPLSLSTPCLPKLSFCLWALEVEEVEERRRQEDRRKGRWREEEVEGGGGWRRGRKGRQGVGGGGGCLLPACWGGTPSFLSQCLCVMCPVSISQ